MGGRLVGSKWAAGASQRRRGPLGAVLDASDPRLWWICFLTVAIVYALTATYSLRQSVDTVNTAVQAHQIALTGSPAVDALENPGGMAGAQLRDGREGLVTDRHPGPVLAGVVGYFLARPVLGDDNSATTYADVPIWPAALTALLATAAAVACVCLALVRTEGLTRLEAIAATVVFAFGTATWSVSANALWPHSVAQLGIGFALLGMVGHRSMRVGLGFAVSVVARMHTAVIAVAAGLAGSLERRSVRPVLVVGALSSLGLAAAMLYGVWVFGGEPSPTVGRGGVTERLAFGGGDSSLLGTLRNELLLLVHPLRGVLPATPVLIPLTMAVPAAWRKAPMWVRGLAVGGLVQLLVQGAVNIYTGGDAFFGSRVSLEFLTATVPLWALAYAATSDRPRLRDWTHAAAVGSIVLHALGATIFTLGF